MSMHGSLTDKPWEQISGAAADSIEDKVKTRRIGLRVLLAVICMLFFLFLVAFLMRSQYPDWQPLAEEPSHPLYNKQILWLNTAYLILASVFMQWSRVVARKSDMSAAVMQGTLALAGVFSVAFVTGQLMFWQTLQSQGFTVDLNPAISFFYLFTGLHAAHVIIGLLAWLTAFFVAFKRHPKMQHYIELCAIYWHFLLGLWAGLFILLVSKPETYDAIAAFCGLR